MFYPRPRCAASSERWSMNATQSLPPVPTTAHREPSLFSGPPTAHRASHKSGPDGKVAHPTPLVPERPTDRRARGEPRDDDRGRQRKMVDQAANASVATLGSSSRQAHRETSIPTATIPGIKIAVATRDV